MQPQYTVPVVPATSQNQPRLRHSARWFEDTRYRQMCIKAQKSIQSSHINYNTSIEPDNTSLCNDDTKYFCSNLQNIYNESNHDVIHFQNGHTTNINFEISSNHSEQCHLNQNQSQSHKPQKPINPKLSKPIDINQNFIYKYGYISSGHDLEIKQMKIRDAKHYALKLRNCIGFTFNLYDISNDTDINEEDVTTIFFKSGGIYSENYGFDKWHTYLKCKSMMDDVNKQINEQQSELDELRRNNMELQENINQKHNELHASNAEVQKLMDWIAKQNKELDRLNLHKTNTDAKNWELMKQAKDLEVKAKEFELKAIEFEQENEKLSAKMKKVKSRNRDRVRISTDQDDEKSPKYKLITIITWEWKENDGSWHAYDRETSDAITDLRVNHKYAFTFSGNGQRYQITKKSDDTAEQCNMVTNVVRSVRRILTERISNGVEYPRWWNMNIIDVDTEYAKPHTVLLNLNTSPGKDVVANFNKTCSDHTVIKVESIQNQMLYDDYWYSRKKLIKLIGEDNLNERDVFHGTKSEDTMDQIQHEGFRKEFNRASAYGEGTYFARDASYSVGYACNDNNSDCNKMFQCRVMMGESDLGRNTYKLTTWPRKNDGLLYDSLVDDVNNPSIFVIHQNVRAYPMYIIYFK